MHRFTLKRRQPWIDSTHELGGNTQPRSVNEEIQIIPRRAVRTPNVRKNRENLLGRRLT